MKQRIGIDKLPVEIIKGIKDGAYKVKDVRGSKIAYNVSINDVNTIVVWNDLLKIPTTVFITK